MPGSIVASHGAYDIKKHEVISICQEENVNTESNIELFQKIIAENPDNKKINFFNSVTTGGRTKNTTFFPHSSIAKKNLPSQDFYRIFTISDKGVTMSKSKANLFSQEEIKIAEIAKALSHPARVKILSILACSQTCMCGDIVEMMPLSQSTVSQHLKELKKAGLIHGEIEGPKICYCINPKFIQKAKEAFANLFSIICDCQSVKKE